VERDGRRGRAARARALSTPHPPPPPCSLYGSEAGVDFADNQARFALFCRAALAAITALPCSPGAESAVVVANDWHSALVPVLLKHVEQPAGRLTGVKVVSCLHNASFQGRFPRAAFAVLGLPVAAAAGFAFADGDPRTFAEGEPDPGPAPAGAKFEKINWLKAGVLASDRVVTVSPTYARELTAGPDKGVELEGVFASLPSERGTRVGWRAVLLFLVPTPTPPPHHPQAAPTRATTTGRTSPLGRPPPTGTSMCPTAPRRWPRARPRPRRRSRPSWDSPWTRLPP